MNAPRDYQLGINEEVGQKDKRESSTLGSTASSTGYGGTTSGSIGPIHRLDKQEQMNNQENINRDISNESVQTDNKNKNYTLK